MKNKPKNIPNLKPSQFDDYIFTGWKPSISDFYEQFHIELIENYKNNLQLPLAPHRRSVYFFIFLTKGQAIRSKGLTNFVIEANQFFFLPANQITSLEYISEEAEGFYCHFMPEIFNQPMIKIDLEKDFSFFQLTAEPLLKANEPERFNKILQILFDENKKNQQARFDLVPIYLLTLFTELKHQVQNLEVQSKNASTFITQRYKNALSELIYEKKTVQEFADYLSVSANHLHKCVKATTGKSAHELLEEMRILEAKVLLKQTNLSIAEIAYKVGKFDPSDFSRFFKSKVQYTPLQYRKSSN